jgi:hypothetical protein
VRSDNTRGEDRGRKSKRTKKASRSRATRFAFNPMLSRTHFFADVLSSSPATGTVFRTNDRFSTKKEFFPTESAAVRSGKDGHVISVKQQRNPGLVRYRFESVLGAVGPQDAEWRENLRHYVSGLQTRPVMPPVRFPILDSISSSATSTEQQQVRTMLREGSVLSVEREREFHEKIGHEAPPLAPLDMSETPLTPSSLARRSLDNK